MVAKATCDTTGRRPTTMDERATKVIMWREAGTQGENDGEEGGISGVQDTGQEGGEQADKQTDNARCSVTTVTATD